MQLQGELLSKGTGAPRLYKGALDCFTKTLRGEGVKGVQRGLGAALGYQVSGSRGASGATARGKSRAAGSEWIDSGGEEAGRRAARKDWEKSRSGRAEQAAAVHCRQRRAETACKDKLGSLARSA
jgi:hypothetical protein